MILAERLLVQFAEAQHLEEGTLPRSVQSLQAIDEVDLHWNPWLARGLSSFVLLIDWLKLWHTPRISKPTSKLMLKHVSWTWGQGGGTKASRTLLMLYRRLRSCKSKLMNWWRWWWVGMILIIMLMMIWWWWWWRRRWWGWGWGRGRRRGRRQLPIPC